MTNCSSIQSPTMSVRCISAAASRDKTKVSQQAYTKDGVLFLPIREFRSAIRLMKSYDRYALRQEQQSRYSNPSAWRREQRLRRSKINEIRIAVSDYAKMHTANPTNNSWYNMYLAGIYKPVHMSLEQVSKAKNYVIRDIATRSHVYNLNKKEHRPWTLRDPWMDQHIHKRVSRSGLPKYDSSMKYAKDYRYQEYLNLVVHKPTPKVNYRNLDLATKIARDEISRYTFKFMPYNQVIKSSDFLKIKNHSTGFTAPGFSDKLKAAKDPGFRDFYNQFKSNMHSPGTFNLFFKNESIKQEKLQVRGPRVIVASSLEHEMLSREVLQFYLSDVMRQSKDAPIKIGMKNTEFGDLLNYLGGPNQYMYCADFSAQDKFMPTQIMHRTNENRVSLARSQGMSRQFQDQLAHVHYAALNKDVVMSNGQVVQLNTLFPTGQVPTAQWNSENHHLLWIYTLLELGLTEQEVRDMPRAHYGDDVILGDSGRLHGTRSQVEKIALDLGMPMTFDAWGERPFHKDGSSNSNVTFLKRSFDEYAGQTIPVYESDRVMAKMLTPYRNISTPEDSVDRLFSFALLCGGRESKYNAVMDTIREICRSEGLDRSYVNLSYDDMVHGLYIGDRSFRSGIINRDVLNWEQRELTQLDEDQK